MDSVCPTYSSGPVAATFIFLSYLNDRMGRLINNVSATSCRPFMKPVHVTRGVVNRTEGTAEGGSGFSFCFCLVVTFVYPRFEYV